jgi:UV DNA damage endonuclease
MRFPLAGQGRIGFACKWVADDKGERERLNLKGTTITHLRTLDETQRRAKLMGVVEHNLAAARALVTRVAQEPSEGRMLRLSSDMLPAYTHDIAKFFYADTGVQGVLRDGLMHIGNAARTGDVRLSFHPDQFVILGSDRAEVVESSLRELEYHADLIRMMGYGKFQDVKCNVHANGKLGVEGVRATLSRLSHEARANLTLENDEYSVGLDELLKLADVVPIVLDIHHHWIHSKGEHLRSDDPRVERVMDSWRGARPVLHYSYSRQEYLGNLRTLPKFEELVKQYPSARLREHSEDYPNPVANRWALGFAERFDIMCECKTKNLGAMQLRRAAEKLRQD